MIIVFFVKKATTAKAVAILALVCKSWRDLLCGTETRFWSDILKTIELDRQKLFAGRYRLFPDVFSHLPLFRRWACTKGRAVLKEGFTGFATSVLRLDKMTFVCEGYFVNSFMKYGVKYNIGLEIFEGQFVDQELFSHGKYDTWTIQPGRWHIFFGHIFPREDFRDIGTAMWADGSSYSGEFLRCEMHGVGVLRDASGHIQLAGRWIHNVFSEHICLTVLSFVVLYRKTAVINFSSLL